MNNNEFASDHLTGYMHPGYAASLAEFGTPIELPKCGGWILKREIPGTIYSDAMGCYPLFLCKDWSRLVVDITNLKGKLISLTLVTDPFGNYDLSLLKKCFQDVSKPYKQHFIVDLNIPIHNYISDNHRRNARKALQEVAVEVCHDPLNYIDDWVYLYSQLIEKHQIHGILRFSREVFARQCNVPGIVMFRAIYKGVTIGMVLWYVIEERSYYHLGAYSPLGYKLKASFALFWRSFEYFSDKVRWLNLGAGSGLDSNVNDGLTRFKRGWSTGTKTAYICGRILDPTKYSTVKKTKLTPESDYFPAYRIGEFD
jgi:hypothetical protein